MRRLVLLLTLVLAASLTWAQASQPQLVRQGLPPGMTFPASGVLSGSPTTFGVYTFTLQVTDGETPPQTASQKFTVTIAPCPLAITSVSLPSGTVNNPYSVQLTATCGDGNYTWTVTSTSSPATTNVPPVAK